MVHPAEAKKVQSGSSYGLLHPGLPADLPKVLLRHLVLSSGEPRVCHTDADDANAEEFAWPRSNLDYGRTQSQNQQQHLGHTRWPRQLKTNGVYNQGGPHFICYPIFLPCCDSSVSVPSRGPKQLLRGALIIHHDAV